MNSMDGQTDSRKDSGNKKPAWEVPDGIQGIQGQQGQREKFSLHSV